MSLLDTARDTTSRGTSIEDRVEALENYIALLLGTADIADNAISSDKIQTAAVSELKIAAAAVTASKTAIAAISSSSGNLVANSVAAVNIQSGAITTEKIYAGAITADKITVSTLAAISANIGNITAGTLTGLTVQTNTSGKRIKMANDILQAFDASNSYERIRIDSGKIWLSQGDTSFSEYDSGSIAFTSSGLVLVNNAEGGGVSLTLGGSNAYLWGNFYLNGYLFDPSDYLTISTFSSHTGSVSAHHSSTSNGLSITPASVVVSGVCRPASANSYSCGTSSYYWTRVYSDAYFTKNTTWQTGWDKYDDLQVIRDLKTFKDKKKATGYSLDITSLPKELFDKDFVDFGGMQSFGLCVSKRIVECIDDMKLQIDTLSKQVKLLKGGAKNEGK